MISTRDWLSRIIDGFWILESNVAHHAISKEGDGRLNSFYGRPKLNDGSTSSIETKERAIM